MKNIVELIKLADTVHRVKSYLDSLGDKLKSTTVVVGDKEFSQRVKAENEYYTKYEEWTELRKETDKVACSILNAVRTPVTYQHNNVYTLVFIGDKYTGSCTAELSLKRHGIEIYRYKYNIDDDI